MLLGMPQKVALKIGVNPSLSILKYVSVPSDVKRQTSGCGILIV